MGSIADEILPEGQWEPLVGASHPVPRDVSEVASGAMVRRRRPCARDDTERRPARAQVSVQMGELSSGRVHWKRRKFAAVAEPNPEATSTKRTNSRAFVGAQSAR